MLEAYALSGLPGRALALRSLVGLTGDGGAERTGWVHVAYNGTWEGHPEGAFTLDGTAFDSVIAAFESQANPVPCDYEHSSVRDVAKAPAAGWVQSVERRGDELWAKIEWTQTAADEIRSGQYRYCSGVFVFDKPDRKSGAPVACSLHSIALTNTPFIDGQQPIALSQRRIALAHGGSMEIAREALEAALKSIEGDKFTAEQLHALVDGVAKMAEAGDPKAGKGDEPEAAAAGDKPVEAKPEDKPKGKPEDEEKPKDKALADAPVVPAAEAPMPDTAVDPAALLAEFEALAAQMGTDLAGLLEKVRGMAGGGEVNPASLSVEATALAASVKALSAQLEGYRVKERAERDAKAKADRVTLDAEVDAMVDQGLVLRADVGSWRALAHKDAASFRALKGTVKPAVPTGVQAAGMPAASGQTFALDDSNPAVKELRSKLVIYGITDRAKQDAAIERAMPQKSTSVVG